MTRQERRERPLDHQWIDLQHGSRPLDKQVMRAIGVALVRLLAEDMEQLEDRNLWTRYTLEDDFAMVEKTTSKYRVPAESRGAAERQALLDRAYADALERQGRLAITTSPRAISEMADAYVRSQALMMVTRQDVKRFVFGSRLLGPVAAFRKPVVEGLRGWRLIR